MEEGQRRFSTAQQISLETLKVNFNFILKVKTIIFFVYLIFYVFALKILMLFNV